jgi:Na+/melibiose symporter-like transporter
LVQVSIKNHEFLRSFLLYLPLKIICMGRKSDETTTLSTKWITFSALGLLLFTAGIVVLMETTKMYVSGDDLSEWIGFLVVAIVIMNAGISFVGTSIKYRIYLDRKRKQESETHTSRSGGSHRHSRSSSHRSSAEAEE